MLAIRLLPVAVIVPVAVMQGRPGAQVARVLVLGRAQVMRVAKRVHASSGLGRLYQALAQAPHSAHQLGRLDPLPLMDGQRMDARRQLDDRSMRPRREVNAGLEPQRLGISGNPVGQPAAIIRQRSLFPAGAPLHEPPMVGLAQGHPDTPGEGVGTTDDGDLQAAAGEEVPVVDRAGVVGQKGPGRPLRFALAGATVVAAVLPWLPRAWLVALFVVLSAITVGLVWTPTMSLLTHRVEALGLDYAYGFALINLAWAPGAFIGPAAGGALAQATSDAAPYLLLSAGCALTLAALWRSRSSS